MTTRVHILFQCTYSCHSGLPLGTPQTVMIATAHSGSLTRYQNDHMFSVRPPRKACPKPNHTFQCSEEETNISCPFLSLRCIHAAQTHAHSECTHSHNKLQALTHFQLFENSFEPFSHVCKRAVQSESHRNGKKGH